MASDPETRQDRPQTDKDVVWVEHDRIRQVERDTGEFVGRALATST